MFTGIITDLGAVRGVDRRPAADTRIEIATAYDAGDIEIGASIACSGPCLTVVDKGSGWFAVEISDETLARTTIGAWREDTPVNLERSLTLDRELGGHIVTGHIDAVVDALAREEIEGSVRFDFSLPAELAPFVAEKGSVALDGVSLTVNGLADDAARSRFDVNLIRHTLEVTTFGALREGGKVNLEVDLLARYVRRQATAGV